MAMTGNWNGPSQLIDAKIAVVDCQSYRHLPPFLGVSFYFHKEWKCVVNHLAETSSRTLVP